MLANLLPGFRHTRTPLVAGSLWLLVAWLAFGDGLVPDAGGSRAESLLYDLGALIGRPAILASVALLAILLGGLAPRIPVRLIARSLPINRRGRWWQAAVCWAFGTEPDLADARGDFTSWLYRRASLIPVDVPWSRFSGAHCPPGLQVAARDLQESGSARIGREVLRNSDFVGDDEPSPRDWLMWGMAKASVRTELDAELPLQLQIERESLFSEYDRVRAESELRAVVVIPMLVLIVILAAESPLWLFAFALPIWLVRQAVQAHLQAEQLLLSAVRYGAIRSSTVEFMDTLRRDEDWDPRRDPAN